MMEFSISSLSSQPWGRVPLIQLSHLPLDSFICAPGQAPVNLEVFKRCLNSPVH